MALEVTNLCKALRCLPREGGLFEQDDYVVTLMSAVLIAQQEKMDHELQRSK